MGVAIRDLQNEVSTNDKLMNILSLNIYWNIVIKAVMSEKYKKPEHFSLSSRV